MKHFPSACLKHTHKQMREHYYRLIDEEKRNQSHQNYFKDLDVTPERNSCESLSTLRLVFVLARHLLSFD